MEWIILPVVLLLFMVALVIFCFCKCFYARNNIIPDPYCNLHGEQYLAVKEKIFECMSQINAACATIPVKAGDVIIKGVAGTDSDIIATADKTN
jgi:hypothetical protein